MKKIFQRIIKGVTVKGAKERNGAEKTKEIPTHRFWGTAQTQPQPFSSSSRGTPFVNFGVPLDDASNAPSTQWNTEKTQRFFIWFVIKCRFDVTSFSKTFWENYGCGYVCAVPECCLTKLFWILGVQTPSLFCVTRWALFRQFRQFSGN